MVRYKAILTNPSQRWTKSKSSPNCPFLPIKTLTRQYPYSIGQTQETKDSTVDAEKIDRQKERSCHPTTSDGQFGEGAGKC